MTSRENYAKAHGAALALLQSNGEIGGALFGEVAMTCLVTVVVLLGAVNAKTRSPQVPITEKKKCEFHFYNKVYLNIMYRYIHGILQVCLGERF